MHSTSPRGSITLGVLDVVSLGTDRCPSLEIEGTEEGTCLEIDRFGQSRATLNIAGPTLRRRSPRFFVGRPGGV